MKALVTGGAGFIGKALVNELVRCGKYEKIVVFDNLVTNPEGVPMGCHFVHGDIRIADDVDRLKFSGPYDVTFHLAASFANELSVNYPRIDLGSNVTGTVNLLTILDKDLGMFVYAASSSSYGNSRGSSFEETDPASPSTPYAMSKHVAEDYVQLIAQRWVSFRLFNVFGPGDVPGRFRNVIPNMIAWSMLRGSFTTYGEEVGAGRDFTYVEDVVRVIALAPLLPANEVYNLCSGKLTTVALISSLIESALEPIIGKPVTVYRKPIREWDTVVRRWGDNQKIAGVLDRLKKSTELRTFQGNEAQETIEWVRDYVLKKGDSIELV